MEKPILTVQKEYLPTRCEICHKADLFDPEKNSCSRCANLMVIGTQRNITAAKVSYIKITVCFMGIVVALKIIEFIFPDIFREVRFPIAALFALCLAGFSLGKSLRSITQKKEQERINRIAGRHIIMLGQRSLDTLVKPNRYKKENNI